MFGKKKQKNNTTMGNKDNGYIDESRIRTMHGDLTGESNQKTSPASSAQTKLQQTGSPFAGEGVEKPILNAAPASARQDSEAMEAATESSKKVYKVSPDQSVERKRKSEEMPWVKEEITQIQPEKGKVFSRKDNRALTQEESNMSQNLPVRKNMPFPGSPNKKNQTSSIKESVERDPLNKAYDKPQKVSTRKSNDKPHSWKGLLSSLAVALLVVVVGVSGYYYWITRIQTEPVEITQEPEQEVEMVEEAPEIPDFSSDQINNVAMGSISIPGERWLESVAGTLRESDQGDIYAWRFVDSEGESVSPQAFAQLFEISLPQEVLAHSEEIRLYAYHDVVGLRYGLAFSLAESETILSTVQEGEGDLYKGLENLYIEDQSSLSVQSYNLSRYGQYEIHYVNLDPQERYSIDYSVDSENNLFFIGTSKETIRNIIDFEEDLIANNQTT